MSDRPRPTDAERPHHAARGRGALNTGTRVDPGQLRLRTIRRAEPDVRKLVEWVLNITQARYDAHRAGEPDPYDLPPPDELTTESHDPSTGERDTMESEASNERSIA